MITHREQLLRIWFESEPSAIYGNPPMWKTFTDIDGLVLFTRPGKTMERPYQEVDGVHWQWQKDGQWIGQGRSASFQWILEKGFAK